ncbi:MAG: DUF2235 domain-containing protein [Gammaproteobacteria bacterium]|nr:DUF2235 domain-containing protein [Gammaproteobacteria bacterium]
MGKSLVLLFDGTWNRYKDRTNVTRMKESILAQDAAGREQRCYYDSGVGTHWYDWLSGGAFGRGLSHNIKQGYAWLGQHYQPGDDIYVFGFSRGAYTARSLVGMIRKCGVLKEVSEYRIEQAYTAYRNKAAAPDAASITTFRKAYSHEPRVKFIGVWDTVGALGIPVSHVPFSRDYYRWHDTELSKIVDFAYHALALDEQRRDYQVTVWSKRKPENVDVEQRWFIGAHANVGGGYPFDPLPNIPLRWLQDQAEGCGLTLGAKQQIGVWDHKAPPVDSFSKFMLGVYKFFKPRYTRPFGSGVNETVDASVWKRWREDAGYRPPTLAAHPDRPAAK